MCRWPLSRLQVSLLFYIMIQRRKWDIFIIFVEDTNQDGTVLLPDHFAGQDETSEGTDESKEHSRERQNEPLRAQLQHYEELARGSLQCARSPGDDPLASVSFTDSGRDLLSGLLLPTATARREGVGGSLQFRSRGTSRRPTLSSGKLRAAPRVPGPPSASSAGGAAGGARRGRRAEARPHGAISARPGRPWPWEALPGAGRCAPPASCPAPAAGGFRRRGRAARAVRPPPAPLCPPAPR